MLKHLLFSTLILATLNAVPRPARAESAAPEKDPFGFGTIQGALDEAKRTGKISPETKAELERIQKRGQEASATLAREKVGQEDCQTGKRLLSINKSYREADPYFRKSLALREKAYGQYDPLLMEPLIGLGECYAKQGWRNEGAQLFLRAIAIGEPAVAKAPRNDYLQKAQAQIIEIQLGNALSNLGRAYEDQGKLTQAEAVYKKSMALGAKYPIIKQLSMTTYSYARLLRKMHRDGEAMEIEARK